MSVIDLREEVSSVRYEPVPSEEPGPDAVFGVSGEDVAAEMLGLCDEFFRGAGSVVHAELERFLIDRGYHGGWGWFIDSLGFSVPDRADRGDPGGVSG